MIQIKSHTVQMSIDDLKEINGEVTIREIVIDKIRVLVDKRVENMTGKFDWYKSEDGKLLLEIQKIVTD